MMISLHKRIKRFENQFEVQVFLSKKLEPRIDIYKQSDYNETKTRNENPFEVQVFLSKKLEPRIQKGVLFTWKDEKGFGFILPENCGEDDSY